MTAASTGDQPTVGRAADTPLQVFFAWERWGEFINARPGDDVEIPYDAARLEVKVYPHPMGEVRVLRFPKTRTHDHINKTDTILYEWTARRVQFVGDDAAVCEPGHVALHPKGVFHHGETLTPGLAVEFAMEVGAAAPNPMPTFVPPAQAPLLDAAWWQDGERVVEAEGAGVAGAPGHATRYRRRTVELGRYTVRELHLAAGSRVPGSRPGAATMIVVLSGEVAIPGAAGAVVLGAEDNAGFARGATVGLRARTETVVLQAIIG